MGENPEILGHLAAIGIVKGQPFEPDSAHASDPQGGRERGLSHGQDADLEAARQKVLLVSRRELLADSLSRAAPTLGNWMVCRCRISAPHSISTRPESRRRWR